MAITITTDLAANVAAFAPCIVEGTTDRWPFSGTTRKTTSIDAMGSNGGNLQLEVISNSGWYVNDIVEIREATGDFAQYNGRHKVLSLETTDYITLDTTWFAATTGSTGDVYRMNDNLQIMAEVENQTTGDVIATLYAQVIDGAFSFDFSKAFQSQLSTVFSLTAGELSPASLSEEFDIYFTEIYQNVNYSPFEGSDTSSTAKVAHRTTEYSSDYVSGTELLTGAMYGKDKVVFHFMTDKTSDVRIRIQTNKAGLEAGATQTTAITTITRQHAAITFNWPLSSDETLTAAPYFYLDVQWNDAGTWTSIKTPILFKLITGCHSTQLYYVNRLGGYESYKFTSYDDMQRTVKVDKYTAEAWQERTLEGQVYPRGTFQTIRDVITSPEVYDEDGTLVEVLSESLQYRAAEVSPIITIRYDETFINS